MARLFLVVAGVHGFLAVALGAFAAHGLSAHLGSQMLEVFRTGAQYQLTQALALLAVAIVLDRNPARALQFSGWAFSLGLLLFPFSLYFLVLFELPALGAITPLGGLAFLCGWAGLFVYGIGQLKRGH